MSKHRFSLLAIVLGAAASLQAQVSFDRILRANDEPQNWLTHSGSVSSQRHSRLTQITTDNVRNLELQWVFQARSLEKYEATSIVVDGILYTVQAPNDVVALDAAPGENIDPSRLPSMTPPATPSAVCAAPARKPPPCPYPA